MRTQRVLEICLVVVVLFVGASAVQAQADHYLCYKGALSKGQAKFTMPLPTKELKDRFEDKTYNAKNPTWHCNPVEKTYNNVIEPIHHSNIHLEGYPIALTATHPAQVKFTPTDITTTDQFGTLNFTVKTPESVAVRTSKTKIAPYPFAACSPTKPCTIPGTSCSPAPVGPGFCLPTFTAPTAPADDGSVDNFKCYKIALPKGVKFTPIVGAVKLADQFAIAGSVCLKGDPAKLNRPCTTNANCDGPSPKVGNGVCGASRWALDRAFDTFDIKKPTRFCTPVDKAHENPGAETHNGYLVCYQIALSALPKGLPKGTLKAQFPKFKVALNNGNFPNNQLDVTAVKELCVPRATVCGDGIADQPLEDCDPPGNTTQCPGSAACSATCGCPVVTGCFDYHAAGSLIDICQSIFGSTCGPQDPPPAIPDAPGSGSQTTFNLCTSDADVAGRRALTVDPATWFADALFIPPPSAPFPVTERMCPTMPLTGVLFTTADAGSFPGTVCLTGDPAKLRTSCSTHGDCDGPTPTAGNGVCGARDVSYTSQTTSAGTVFTFGGGTGDPAGSAMLAQDLRVDVWLGGDRRCTGTGSDPSCVSCDDSTPAPAGRQGIQCAVTTNVACGGDEFAGPALSLPLQTRFTTGSAENKVVQAANPLNNREVTGSGQPSQTASLRVVGANAQLNISTPLGTAHIQFFTKQAFSPVVP